MRGLLPACVAVAESDGGTAPRQPSAFPEELDHIAHAVPARRAEFLQVRQCARRALTAAGFRAGPLLPGPDRAPRWPAGAVGSMTHCTGYRAAAVAPTARIRAVGIDAEPHEALPPEVRALIADPGERAALRRLATEHPRVHWDRLLFSAKESVFKAWYPLTGEWLDFHDAQVALDPASGGFTARLATTELHGRWAVTAGLLTTAVTLPAQPAQRNLTGSAENAPCRVER
ncbi:4'-phosphopantetheinyl transferase superfamily protein [Streptomyces sp. NPDC052225]|uniref:4'-phosphopantetheinyl transferase family protein n=1 Tax=Streptomyces sp. NPDC052225 TaxID=3154949 RepID=UPI00342C4E3E